MAENETLHLGDKRNRCWRHLCEGVLGGASVGETAERVTRCVESVMKNILRDDAMRGGPEYPFSDLLNALPKGRDAVNEVLSRCGGHDYAYLLAEEESGQPEDVLSRHFDRIAANFMEQIGIATTPRRFATFPEFQSFRAAVEEAARPRLQLLAKQVAANPTKPPRSLPRDKRAKQAAHSTLLRESLLSRMGAGQ